MSIAAANWAFKQATQRTGEKLVLLALAHRHHAATGACTPAVQTLVAMTGLSERAVRYALRGLERQGLVRTRRRTSGGRFTSNEYDLQLDRGAPAASRVDPDKADAPPKVADPAPDAQDVGRAEPAGGRCEGSVEQGDVA